MAFLIFNTHTWHPLKIVLVNSDITINYIYVKYKILYFEKLHIYVWFICILIYMYLFLTWLRITMSFCLVQEKNYRILSIFFPSLSHWLSCRHHLEFVSCCCCSLFVVIISNYFVFIAVEFQSIYLDVGALFSFFV